MAWVVKGNLKGPKGDTGDTGVSPITSVFGRVGAVIALAGDYTVGQVTGAVPNTLTLTAGNGLTGGGTLATDRSFALGTPGTLSGSTTNAVQATSHTHALSANLSAWDAISPSDPIFTGQMAASNIGIQAGSSAANANLFLRDDTGINQGVLYWNRADDTIRLRRYNEAATGQAGELVLTETGLLWNSNNVWHAGNFDPATKANDSAVVHTAGNESITGVKTFANTISGNISGSASNVRDVSVVAGNGLTGGGVLSASKTITLGTPSSITLATTNSVQTASHTHAFVPGGTAGQYIRGDGALANFPTITGGGVQSSDANAIPAGDRLGYMVSPTTNTPNGSWTQILSSLESGQWGYQLAKPWFEDALYLRSLTSGTFGPWNAIYHTGNFDAASKATADWITTVGFVSSNKGAPYFRHQDGTLVPIDPTSLLGYTPARVDNPTFTGTVTAPSFTASGTGLSYTIGDDSAIHDVNIANTMGIHGLQNPNQAFIRYGNTNSCIVGFNGTSFNINGYPVHHHGTLIGDAQVTSLRSGDRLGAAAEIITDWNNALTNGWFMGSGTTNAPTAAWLLGEVMVHNSNWVTQTVHAFTEDGPTDARTWRRSRNNGTWSAWYRLRLNEDEQNAVLGTLVKTPNTIVRRNANGAIETGGIGFANVVAVGLDITKHVALYSNTHGINVINQNVQIVAGSASYKFHDNGTATATNWAATSDARLKNIIGPAPIKPRLADLLELFDFTWKNNGKAGRSPIAQHVQRIAPEYVHENENGELSIDKSSLALDCIIGLAKRVAELERKHGAT